MQVEIKHIDGTTIREGDTPSNHPIAKIVEGWILEWQADHPEVANVPA